MFLPVVDLIVDGPHPEPVSVIYPPLSVNWSEILDRTISELTNIRLPPSRILFICPRGVDIALANEFNAQQKHLLERLRATSHVVVAAYDHSGQVKEDNVVNLRFDGHEWTVTDKFVQIAATEYIAALCNRTNALLSAPAGYQFQKPSGSSSTIFLRAGNMLRELDSMNVYSHMLLRRWPLGAKWIYIDSFTILSFAMALQNIVRFFADDGVQVPAIENFHSYDKDRGFSFPPDDDYIIIISASTSGDLATELVESHGADETKIVHLVGAGHGHRGAFPKSCIYFHTLQPTRDSVALDDIRIGGEEFLPSYGQPARVRLTTGHIRDDDARRYKHTFYQKNLKIQRSASTAGYGSYALFSIANEACDLGPDSFNDWLVEHLVHEVPANASLIVHLPDRMSVEMAARIAKEARSLNAAKIVADEDVLKHKAKLSRRDAVLIVASEDPNLEAFVRISTELRRWPDAYRHFVLAHAFPETKEDFYKVVKSLRMRARDLPQYGWSTFAVAPVGRQDQHARWLFDYPVNFNGIPGIKRDFPLPEMLLVQADEDRIFLPKLDGNRLSLRQGSVFFEGEYDQLPDAVVYLAVATAVQRARESGGTGAPSLRFDPNPFVGSVIDPQMFSRYSDGILQAALLRCLYPSELDYSRSAVLSRHVRELVMAVLRNANNVVGEAALEFMAALSVGKISLREQDNDVVQTEIRKNDKLALIWKAFTTQTPI